jgi:hypothetical protein
MEKNALMQLVTEATRGKNTLDLVMTNRSEMVLRINTIPTSLSDHRFIRTDIGLPTKIHKIRETRHEGIFSERNMYSKSIEWSVINEKIDELNWEEIMKDKTPDEALNKMENIISEILLKYTPKRMGKNKRNKYEKLVRTLYKKRRKLVDQLLKSNLEIRKAELEASLRNNDEELQKAIREKESREELLAIEKISTNTKYFFTYANRKRTTTSKVGPLINKNQKYVEDPQEISELLNEQFKNSFTKPKPQWKIESIEDHFRIDPNDNNTLDQNFLENFTFTKDDMVGAMSKIKENAAAGPDTWSAKFLKECKSTMARPLCILWRKSLDTGLIPNKLKETNITPIFKGGDRSMAKNYRPVALTSHLIKIFERIAREKIAKHLDKHDLYNPDQHGFRSGRSCLSQLLDHQEAIVEALCDGCGYDVIYTDFAKAFDKCDHNILAHKLKTVGVVGKIGKWIYNFLTNRTQRVLVDGSKSTHVEVTSSVPQGTVLAPILFLIMISDINKNARDCKVSSFADDTKVSRVINNKEDVKALQGDINSIFEWADENNMYFNGDKFVSLQYRIKNNNIAANYVTSAGVQINRESQAKDLGVIMETDTGFSGHYKLKLAIARKLIGIICRSFKSRKASVMIRLWKSLILPVIEYCSVLVSPYKKKDIEEIEAIQRTYTAKIEEVKQLNYWERLKELNMYSLERRRERYLIIYIWKIIESRVPNCTLNPIDVYWSDRQGRLCKITKRKGQGKYQSMREQTLAVRGPKLFNCLPPHIRNLQDVQLPKFKKALDDYLREVPDCPILKGYKDPFGQESNSIGHRKLKITTSADFRAKQAGLSSRPGSKTSPPGSV